MCAGFRVILRHLEGFPRRHGGDRGVRPAAARVGGAARGGYGIARGGDGNERRGVYGVGRMHPRSRSTVLGILACFIIILNNVHRTRRFGINHQPSPQCQAERPQSVRVYGRIEGHYNLMLLLPC